MAIRSGRTQYTLPALNGNHPDELANDSLVGGFHICHYYTIAAAAAANYDHVLTYNTLITRAQVINTGAGVAGSTVEIQTAAAAPITDVMDTSGLEHTCVHSAELHYDVARIAAGGTVRIACAGGIGCPDMVVLIFGVRVA